MTTTIFGWTPNTTPFNNTPFTGSPFNTQFNGFNPFWTSPVNFPTGYNSFQGFTPQAGFPHGVNIPGQPTPYTPGFNAYGPTIGTPYQQGTTPWNTTYPTGTFNWPAYNFQPAPQPFHTPWIGQNWWNNQITGYPNTAFSLGNPLQTMQPFHFGAPIAGWPTGSPYAIPFGQPFASPAYFQNGFPGQPFGMPVNPAFFGTPYPQTAAWNAGNWQTSGFANTPTGVPNNPTTNGFQSVGGYANNFAGSTAGCTGREAA